MSSLHDFLLIAGQLVPFVNRTSNDVVVEYVDDYTPAEILQLRRRRLVGQKLAAQALQLLALGSNRRRRKRAVEVARRRARGLS